MGGSDSSHMVWTWARQDVERNFSVLDADKGIFTVPERHSGGGRVFCMTSTGEMDKRIWIGTAVSCSHTHAGAHYDVINIFRIMRYKCLAQ